MKENLTVNEHITIPEHELVITASRSGGPGGQHVNKTNTRITIRWNVKNSTALDQTHKDRVMAKLSSQLTNDGELIIHAGSSRSQDHNKKIALAQLASIIRSALHIPKQRKKKRISRSAHETRLETKSHRSKIKKMRNIKLDI